MRVRIVSSMKGDIDGIDLTKFEIGRVYDMGTSLANYLMASGYAVPVADERPALVVPLDEADRHTTSPLAEAADKPRRQRRR
jgi:hypothetical protein